MPENEIQASQADWLLQALQAYRDKQPFEFVDDKELGFTPEDFESGAKLLAAARSRARLPIRAIMATLSSLGLSAVGVWMIIAALADPEPTSTLAVLIAGGVVLTLAGSFSTLLALGVRFRVSVGTRGIEVSPGD